MEVYQGSTGLVGLWVGLVVDLEDLASQLMLMMRKV